MAIPPLMTDERVDELAERLARLERSLLALADAVKSHICASIQFNDSTSESIDLLASGMDALRRRIDAVEDAPSELWLWN